MLNAAASIDGNMLKTCCHLSYLEKRGYKNVNKKISSIED
jgi:hypothetical protein